MTSQSASRIEYRLTFESVDPNWAALFESGGGKYEHLWDEGDWDTMPWRPPTIRVSDANGGIHTQHAQLKRWADSHEQPVRNVRLERRAIVVNDEGWEPVDG